LSEISSHVDAIEGDVGEIFHRVEMMYEELGRLIAAINDQRDRNGQNDRCNRAQQIGCGAGVRGDKK
jgi:hypothetical protein